MILMREKCTSSRSRDHHGLFFMNKQRLCVWARIEHGMAKVSQEESQETKREFSEVPILSDIGSLTFCQLMKRLPM